MRRSSLFLTSGGLAAALRASLGHPEPFALRFVEVGNEVRPQWTPPSSPRGLMQLYLPRTSLAALPARALCVECGVRRGAQLTCT